MIGLLPIARMVAGSILMTIGLIAIPLPVFPGIPLVLLGATIGFGWHPRGLRILRKLKVKLGRGWRRLRKQSA